MAAIADPKSVKNIPKDFLFFMDPMVMNYLEKKCAA
jgi:hypothetical protein